MPDLSLIDDMTATGYYVRPIGYRFELRRRSTSAQPYPTIMVLDFSFEKITANRTKSRKLFSHFSHAVLAWRDHVRDATGARMEACDEK